VRVRAWNQVIVLDPARESEPGSVAQAIDPHGLGVAPQVYNVVRVLRSMRGYQDIARKSVARPYRAIHQAVEPVAADISGFSANRMPGSIAGQV
jgi:hypothetical protein